MVQITANYLGSNALDLEKTVAQPIEEQLAGLDGMLYFLSTSANNGTITILVTFKLGTNPDIASVQTQNKVNIALPRLPPEVQRQGVVVKKVSSAFLMAVGLVSPDGRYDSLFLNNYAQINLLNQIGSLPGVGDTRLTSQQVYSMRVWVDPDKMAKLGVTATDISNAINAQNRQNPAGATGQAPAPPGTDFQYAVNAPGRLTDPAQFGDIIVRALPDASLLRIRDIGRVELGAQNYAGFSRLDGKPFGNTIVYLSPGANAVETAKECQGISWRKPRRASRRVSTTLSRTIPRCSCARDHRRGHHAARSDRPGDSGGLHLPAELARHADSAADRAGGRGGNLCAVPAAGFQHQYHQHVRPGAGDRHRGGRRDCGGGSRAAQYGRRHASARSHHARHGSGVGAGRGHRGDSCGGIHSGGVPGRHQRPDLPAIRADHCGVGADFGVQRAIAEPGARARCFCGRIRNRRAARWHWFFGYFNRAFEWTTNRYLAGVGMLIRRSALALLILGVFWVSAGWLFKKLPNGFLPDEDQGAFFVSVHLPDGASIDRNSLATGEDRKRGLEAAGRGPLLSFWAARISRRKPATPTSPRSSLRLSRGTNENRPTSSYRRFSRQPQRGFARFRRRSVSLSACRRFSA